MTFQRSLFGRVEASLAARRITAHTWTTCVRALTSDASTVTLAGTAGHIPTRQ